MKFFTVAVLRFQLFAKALIKNFLSIIIARRYIFGKSFKQEVEIFASVLDFFGRCRW